MGRNMDNDALNAMLDDSLLTG
ncbi:MAG TPA: hypothetical protein DDW68_13095 [Verrucomicrobiales bacterium]|nr:hypothetical protein [Verrucomicrobiales bacterium]